MERRPAVNKRLSPGKKKPKKSPDSAKITATIPTKAKGPRVLINTSGLRRVSKKVKI